VHATTLKKEVLFMKKTLLAVLLVILSASHSHSFTFYGLEFGKPRPCQGAEQEHKGYVSCPIDLAEFEKYKPSETRVMKIDNIAEGLEILFDGRDKDDAALIRALSVKYGRAKQSAFSGASYKKFVWHRTGYLMQLLVVPCAKPMRPAEKVSPHSVTRTPFCLERMTVESPKLVGATQRTKPQAPLYK